MVSQAYSTKAEDEYIIRGNSAILKCKIPSYLADFIVVDAWIDDDGNEIEMTNNARDLGLDFSSSYVPEISSYPSP